MKGLELARKYYEEFGKPMLEEQFPDLMPYIATGLAGSGSECLGYDDDTSSDHDFEPGFCIFLPSEDIIDRRAAFKLERAYAKLPKEFEGYTRSMMDPVGGSRHGVIRTADFYRDKTGLDLSLPADGQEDDKHNDPSSLISSADWFHIPSYALLEATSGEVFDDPYGEFSRIRQILTDMPEDVRQKKLAAHLLLMAQSGQYNYPRIIAHGEKAAAQMAVYEFINNCLNVLFLLNKAYLPYYKWSFRALRELKLFSHLEDPLYMLMTTDNETENAAVKYQTIEGICTEIATYLKENSLTKAVCTDLEKHAYSINDMIQDSSIRNLNILYAV